MDELSYACAAAAVSVSRNIVHIGLEIRKQRVLSGPYWFMLYTEFFAVLTLIFYAVENPGKPGCAEVLSDARAGRQMIAELVNKSQAAQMITTALTALFEQVPDMMEQGRVRALAAKKRMAGPQKPSLMAAQHQAMASQVMPPAQNGHMSNGTFGTPGSMTSLDQLTADQFHDLAFTGSMQDLYPMEVSSRATPESATSSANHHAFVTQAMAAQGVQNPVHKLDSLMFPSDDPFAYPNQPMMELGYQPKGGDDTAMVQDPNFFFGNESLGNLNDDFLNQTQQFLMQGQAQSQGGMGLTSNLFGQNMMLGLQNQQQQQQPQQPIPTPHVQTPQISRQPSQQSQLSQLSQQQAQQAQVVQPAQRKPKVQRPSVSQPQQAAATPPVQQTRQQQRGRLGLSFFNRRVRAERQQERQQEQQIDQIFTEHGMQADFGSFFGSGRGGFQGM